MHSVNPTSLFVNIFTVRPEIDVRKATRIFEKGMIIYCRLQKRDVNPTDVIYTWYSCDAVNCGNNTTEWKLESHNYSLRIDNQVNVKVKYRCIARNTVGKDESPTITVYKRSDEMKSTTTTNNLLFVVVPIGVITMLILVATCFVLYKRKKIYGGFYLFSYPPLPDYMEVLDINGNIQEQIQKLPFVPEWEFPREKISFSKYNMFFTISIGTKYFNAKFLHFKRLCSCVMIFL